MTDAQYEAKFQEMQKYIPFLQKIIDKLKVSNVQQGDNPRKMQLQKMEMLHELLTNKTKKLKMETLMKCEGVIIKLIAKIEKNEDSILNNIKLKANDKPSTSTSNHVRDSDVVDISGPASPPPEIVTHEIDQPVVIPTERRCSPITVKEKPTNSHNKMQQHHSRQDQDHRHQLHYRPDGQQQQQRVSDKQISDENFQNLRERVFPSQNLDHKSGGSAGSSTHSITKEKHNHQHHDHHHKDPRKDTRNPKEHNRNPKELNSPSQQNPLVRGGQHLSNESYSARESPNTIKTAAIPSDQKLQTVKVVITEPSPARELNSPSQQNPLVRGGQHLSNESYSARESPNTIKTAAIPPVQMLQTVKVVITEPLPAYIKQQHFAPYRQYPTPQHLKPRESICHSNLKTLPQALPSNNIEPAREVNEAYSPKELWEEHKESHIKRQKNTNKNTVFSRLGDKVPESSSGSTNATTPQKTAPISIPGRYTPIPDVLKSPPLSASDINNLLLESGADKVSSDISEIGSRRPQKVGEDKLEKVHESPTNNLEFLRKKLTHVATMNSIQPKAPASPVMEKKSIVKESTIISPLPNERVALKYNPHPRQERLQSFSSNDGSECSIKFRINDPRVKAKILSTNPLQNPSQTTPTNVNVLPSINLYDPRLKRQNTVSLLPTTSSNPNTPNQPAAMAITSQTPIMYGSRKDPRISRVQPIQPPNMQIGAPPVRRLSITQPCYSSEENWDSEPEETAPAKTRVEETRIRPRIEEESIRPRIEEQAPRARVDPRLTSSLDRNYKPISRSVLPKVPPYRRQSTSQPRPNTESDKQHKHAPVEPLQARLPKSDSEENWDSESDVEVSGSSKEPATKHSKPAFSETKNQLPPISQPKPAFSENKTPLPTIPQPIKTKKKMKMNSNFCEDPQFEKAGIQSDTEEDWDSEPELANKMTSSSISTSQKTTQQQQPKATQDQGQQQFPKERPPITPQRISPGHAQIQPYSYGKPMHNISPSPVLPPHHISPIPPNHVSPITHHIPMQHPLATQHLPPNCYAPSAANHRFSAVLNDKSERIKYFEAKKQKTTEPRTYKEFREAKERAAQAEAKKKAEEQKLNKEKETIQQQRPELESTQKTKETSIEKKHSTKQVNTPKSVPLTKNNIKAPSTGESTLDKMYRTQNFHSKFPKANTSFKIPKKKTDEQLQEDAKKANDLEKSTTEKITPKQIDKVIQNPTIEKPTTEKITPKQSDKVIQNQTIEKSTTEKVTPKHNDKVSLNQTVETPSTENVTPKQTDEVTQNKTTGKQLENIAKKSLVQDKIKKVFVKLENIGNKKTAGQKTIQDEDVNKEIDKITSGEQENKTQEIEKPQTPKLAEQKPEDHRNSIDNSKNNRDPRCRPKVHPENKEIEKTSEKDIDNSIPLNDIVITSCENEVALKPQTDKENAITLAEKNKAALDKFNKATQELNPKPQRIFRRRNTMILFGSAPLVDKDKLMKANALLFEDVQEQEKRKRKQEEEDRQNARRNKHLEEMFQKTDDNCTVSTQNIIAGKRRTRATINFNETVVAMNVFKHTSKRDSLNSTPAQTTKNLRSSLRAKTKTSEDISKHTDTEEENDEKNKTEENKKDKEKITDSTEKNNDEETKVSNTSNRKQMQQKVNESDNNEDSKDHDEHPENGPSTSKVKTKNVKKKVAANKKPIKDASNKEVNKQKDSNSSSEEITPVLIPKTDFKPILVDEHQNCAVSSTSAEASCEDQQKLSCSSTSTTSSTTKTCKKETDDNEPTSTANKSNNSTPTPEANKDRDVLKDIVQQIMKPNGQHILELLGQILSEDRLEFIKTLIAKQNEEQQINKDDKTQRQWQKSNKLPEEEDEDEKEEEHEEKVDDATASSSKASNTSGRKASTTKKKRSELDRLNEDIRDMFICEGVLTATGRRMCTIIGQTNSNYDDITSPMPKEPETTSKKRGPKTNLEKAAIAKPTTLRRSLRSCKTNEEAEHDEAGEVNSLKSFSEISDDLNSTTESNTTDTSRKKMPVLKPHTPIKLPEEENPPTVKTQSANKRKSANKPCPKSKKSKNSPVSNDDNTNENLETESEFENETTQTETTIQEEAKNDDKTRIKNTNIHWHNQSKYTNWCLICSKRIPANVSAFHYKMHHGENYISRLAPVLLQKFKQGKLSHPLFGVDKSPKQPSWFYRCPFCLQYFNTPMPLWLEHLQNHTAEFKYECSRCYRGSNRAITTRNHINSQCKGATIITSVVKLTVPTLIKAHVCHLCNFMQLKRANLERHYVEQHQIDKKNVDLLGYTIKLFDVENVEQVPEDKATEREAEAWKSIQSEEQVINIIDDDEEAKDGSTKNIVKDIDGSKEIKTPKDHVNNKTNQIETAKLTNIENQKESEKILIEVKKERTEKQKEKTQKEEKTKSNQGENAIEVSKTQKENGETSQETQKEKFKSKDKLKEPAVLEAEKEKPKSTLPVSKTGKETNVSGAEADKNEEQIIESPKEQESVKETKTQTEKTEHEQTTPKEDGTSGGTNQKIKGQQKAKTKKATKKEKSNQEDNPNIELIIIEDDEAQDVQDELLALAAQAAEEEEKLTEANSITKQTDIIQIPENDLTKTQDESLVLAANTAHDEITEKNLREKYTELIDATADAITKTQVPKQTSSTLELNTFAHETHTTISDLISSSIDRIFKRNKRKSTEMESTETKKSCLDKPSAASNVFMPTRDVNNYSPTILAQSIINIEEQTNQSETSEKPQSISIAERLSQRFKVLQDRTSEKEKPTETEAQSISKPKENPFEKLFNDTVLELEKEKDKFNAIQTITQKESTTEPTKPTTTDDITVISDDEDWEDIEITESAPSTTATSTGNIQKSKNKGLFQKFGMFKGNNTKTKKQIPPLVFLPKKKPKEKCQPQTTTTSSPTPTTKVTTSSYSSNDKTDATATNSNTNLGFKPVINIIEDFLPDSPCNDPIDLVPELAPLEPLQDLNDISSILDSNLSAMDAAVSINVDDNHTSMEDALDFISEQQAQDKQQTSNASLSQTQSKTVINSITHVGYSVQTSGVNDFKFYCLLKNCSFLYSSDAVGLENHFMCEHSNIQWDGYCLMCQTYCFPKTESTHSISKEIKHMVQTHANKTQLELHHTESTQHSTASSLESEERPKIKLRRMTGDCLSTANSENATALEAPVNVAPNTSTPMSMLGALLIAKPKPPTKEMPPQPEMPLTEPLLLDAHDVGPLTSTPFKNLSQDFVITSVSSSAVQQNDSPLQIANVISSNKPSAVNTLTTAEPSQIPIISNVRTLASKVGSSWSQQIAEERQELMEAAAESLEVSQILANAGRPSTSREPTRAQDDSPGPVVVAETVPVAQAKTGDFVITQTVSAQYDENSSAAVGFNISIASTSASATTPNQESIPTDVTTPITSRQYKCMSNSCKFVSRVRVAMSDHLRFHERRNLSYNCDYFACAFCSYQALNVDDYMKHADLYHIINKGGVAATATTTTTELTNTATSLTKKIHDILNSNKSMSANKRNPVGGLLQNQNLPEKDSEEVYLMKLRQTIEEIVEPTGLSDEKLYRCVVKNCRTQLTESTFSNHIMFHISTLGNPNNYIFKCPHCSAQYHRVAGIKAHIKIHAHNRFFCYLCDQTCTNPVQILKHFSDKHWHTLNMYTKILLKPKTLNDEILESGYFVAYTQELSDEDVRKFGEKLILEWQRKKSGSKTHFKSSEIDLLPLPAIFQREVNCGECQYKTKVRTNMYRHLLMHKQNPCLANNSGPSKVASVDPVNPVPCLNSSERFFDKMTNLASSSIIPSSSSAAQTNANNSSKPKFIIPFSFVLDAKRFTCGSPNCKFITLHEEHFRVHLSTTHCNTMSFRCPFCKEDVCKRGLTVDRIINHIRFHGAILHRCEECNYLHHMRYVVERHINEKHATLKVNIVTHERTSTDNAEGTTSTVAFAAKKYKDIADSNQQSQPSTSSATTRSASSESSISNPFTSSSSNSTKGKGKWICDLCGHKATTLVQIQTHVQQQHGSKDQYRCAHCDFGSQQLSQILFHIDEKHSGKTREARYIYHKSVNANDEVADTRPLWQRNDPTRVRHIRGILMENEEESEEYRKKLGLSEDVDDEEDDDLNATTLDYVLGYEFGCFHCDFKTQKFDDLKTQHYQNVHNSVQETAQPFWYRLYKRFCCPECRQFMGNFTELKNHLLYVHNTSRYYAADITIAENDDSSQRLLCGYCSFHCVTLEQLNRHSQKAQHLPQEMRIESNEHIMDMLKLGKSETSYRCTLCADIFPNSVAIVQHACNTHAGEESFSFRELSNSLIYRCAKCCFTSTTEMELLRHMIDHYYSFKKCHFCSVPQTTFNGYMQHCYAEHKSDIQRFREIYPLTQIQKYLLQMLIVFPNGLILTKDNLLNTKYGNTTVIDVLYEDIYKISQQPPIPRLLIGRLVARKSIETQQKHKSSSSSPQTLHTEPEMLKPLPMQGKISKRRCTVAVSEDDSAPNAYHSKHTTNETFIQKPKKIAERRNTLTLANENTSFINSFDEQHIEFNAPLLQPKKISKRRRTVAVDFDAPFNYSSMNSSHGPLLIERDISSKKRKTSISTSSPLTTQETPYYPSNLDMEPFSYYGKTPESVDLSKIYTKVAIGGIKTPLTIDKFKLLFNIECEVKLTKCDHTQMLDYKDYKHIKRACPASHKIRYN